MAPEQAAGHVHKIGPAADIYALGATLYEMLTGRPPFKAPSTMEILHQVIHDDVTPPSRIQARVPRDLETVCLKCLCKEPGKRYATAADLADDLQRFAAGEPVRARRAGPLERTLKWGRRRPALAALIGLAVLCVVGVAVLIVDAVRWFSDHEREVPQARTPGGERIAATRKHLIDQRPKSYASLVAGFPHSEWPD